MTTFTSTGTHGSVPAAHQSSHNIASIGGPATLTRVTISGLVITQTQLITLTTGTNGTYDLVGGIQYGPIGYTVVQNTTGTNAGATYLTYNEFIDTASNQSLLPGNSPQNGMQSSFLSIKVNWRGLHPVPTGADLYMVIGMDTSQTYAPLIEAYFHWSVEWATFP